MLRSIIAGLKGVVNRVCICLAQKFGWYPLVGCNEGIPLKTRYKLHCQPKFHSDSCTMKIFAQSLKKCCTFEHRFSVEMAPSTASCFSPWRVHTLSRHRDFFQRKYSNMMTPLPHCLLLLWWYHLNNHVHWYHDFRFLPHSTRLRFNLHLHFTAKPSYNPKGWPQKKQAPTISTHHKHRMPCHRSLLPCPLPSWSLQEQQHVLSWVSSTEAFAQGHTCRFLGPSSTRKSRWEHLLPFGVMMPFCSKKDKDSFKFFLAPSSQAPTGLKIAENTEKKSTSWISTTAHLPKTPHVTYSKP